MMQHLLMSTNGSAAEHYFHGSNIWWTCKGGDFMTPGWKNVCTWVPKTLRTGRRRFQKRSKRGKRAIRSRVSRRVLTRDVRALRPSGRRASHSEAATMIASASMLALDSAGKEQVKLLATESQMQLRALSLLHQGAFVPRDKFFRHQRLQCIRWLVRSRLPQPAATRRRRLHADHATDRGVNSVRSQEHRRFSRGARAKRRKLQRN